MSSIRIAKCSLPSSGRRRSAPTGSSIQYRPSPSNARPRWCPSRPRLPPEGRAQGDRRGRGVRAFPTWIRIPASGPYPAGPSSGGAAAVAGSWLVERMRWATGSQEAAVARHPGGRASAARRSRDIARGATSGTGAGQHRLPRRRLFPRVGGGMLRSKRVVMDRSRRALLLGGTLTFLAPSRLYAQPHLPPLRRRYEARVNWVCGRCKDL